MNTKIVFALCLLLSSSISFCKKQHVINDFSRLNKTQITNFMEPVTVDELSSILVKAAAQDLNVSISGVRHSQGGHTFYKNALVVSLAKMNKVISLKGNLLTVQAGITWKEVQSYLHERNKAVKIMQFANMFTIGGSLSVNANGIDPHVGPLIESVHALKIMMADGAIVHVSRTEHAELFRLTIGGYGLFGIIIEATLEVVENNLYKKEVTELSLDEYVRSIENIRNDSSVGLHFGQLTLNPWAEKLFSGVRSINYRKIDEQSFSVRKRQRLRKLKPERFVKLKSFLRVCVRRIPFIKYLQKDIDSVAQGTILCRNAIMSPHVGHLHDDTNWEVDLLQEYFIPINNLTLFLDACDSLIRSYSINVVAVHARFIPKNTESFLSYAQHDCFGIVILFSQKNNKAATQNTKRWTQSLIDVTHSLNGLYYLPTQLHATHDQIRRVYPVLDDFFKAKKQYDSQERFINYFYKKYV